MASVWCAEDLVLGRPVAVKVLAESFARDDMAVRRFKREARAAARVSSHAHVVTIYDVGDLGPDEAHPFAPERAFIVMEYLSGGTVADAIRVTAVNRYEALRWLREAASALDHAHSRGIVHRDIKPANFLLDGNRILHVADFGIAHLVSEDTITSSGELFGTAAYLSPEQALGLDATGASDRYALAVAAFELLVGERPFTAPHFAAQARQHIEDPPPNASQRNRTLPTAIDPVLVRGMAKEPADRYETAETMVKAIDDALASPSATPPRVLPSRRTVSADRTTARSIAPAPAARRPHRGRAFALVALVLAALGVGALALAGTGGSSPRPSSPDSSARLLAPVVHRSHRRHRAIASSTTDSSRTASATSSSVTTTAVAQSAEALQQTGHQDLLNGDYQAAIPTLRQAVSAASPGSLTYAYALYDLGRSLTLSGNPNDAIPILRQRLKIPNQTSVVQQALDQALRAAGRTPEAVAQSTTSAQAPGVTSTTPAAPAPSTGEAAPAPSTGGAAPAPATSEAAPAPASGGAGLGAHGHGKPKGQGNDHRGGGGGH